MSNFQGSDFALHNSLYGNYRQRKFTDIYGDKNTFLTDYKENGLPTTISDDTATTLYYLLYARYGNSTIASSDENQFKYKLFSTVFMYGPTWEKRLDIQEKLRTLTDDQLREGSKAIYNHAFNPSTAPSTDTLDELTTINDQNTTKYKKTPMEGYSTLLMLLETDVTAEFLDRFRKLFLVVVEPELPLWYVTDLEDEG